MNKLRKNNLSNHFRIWKPKKWKLLQFQSSLPVSLYLFIKHIIILPAAKEVQQNTIEDEEPLSSRLCSCLKCLFFTFHSWFNSVFNYILVNFYFFEFWNSHYTALTCLLVFIFTPHRPIWRQKTVNSFYYFVFSSHQSFSFTSLVLRIQS